MGTFEDNISSSVRRMPDTRVFQKEVIANPEKEISYTPPKFVTKTLSEHGITFDPKKHLVFTAPGSTQFFLQTKGNTNLVPFESQNDPRKQLEEQLTPLMDNMNQQPPSPEPIPDLSALAKQWEEAVQKETATRPTEQVVGSPLPPPLPSVLPQFMEAPAVTPDIPTTVETIKPERTLESRLQETEATLSPEQKQTYSTLTTWWSSVPEAWQPVIIDTLIKGAQSSGQKAPSPGAVPQPAGGSMPTPEAVSPTSETLSPIEVSEFKAREMHLALDVIEKKKYTGFGTLPEHYQQAGDLMARHMSESVV